MAKEKRILSYFIGWLILGLFICFIGIRSTYAQIINYEYLGKSIGETFSISSNSSISANTFVNVSQDSTKKYLVIDLCSTTGSDISTSVTSNFDGSNTTFYELYDIKKSCSVGSYDGDTIRIFYLIKNWTDSGNGNLAINNTTKFTNNVSWNGSYKLLSLSLSDTIDLGDLSTNNQNIIINGIDNLNTSIDNSTNTITGSIGDAETNINSNIQSTEDNINQNIDDMEQSIVDSNKETQDVIKDQFNNCRDSYNLFNYVNYLNSSINGLTAVINKDGTITVKGKPTSNYTQVVSSQIIDDILEDGKKYTISQGTANNKLYLELRVKNKTDGSNRYYGLSSSRNSTITIDKQNYTYSIYVVTSTIDIWGSENLTITNSYQLNEGTLLSFEKYGEICTNKLDEQNETSKGIWATIKELPTMFLDMLLGLFIPDDLSFIDNFKDVISNKLGFIASIPIQIIDFMLGLADIAFSEITTISFPSIEIFGVHFWNSEDIDITILLEKLKPFKYFTDFTCVILCCRTLYNFYHSFTGGDAN